MSNATANASTTATVGWISDPSGRGTLGLMLSCIATMALCVWSALHLNVPIKDETRRQWWDRYLRWVALGVFIPELVVLAAWRQFTSARGLSQALEKIFRYSENGTFLEKIPSLTEVSTLQKQLRRNRWTRVHSYFAGMGGFALHLDKDQNDFLPVDIPRVTLTVPGVLLIAQCGLLPDIDVEEIKDKSKSDRLAKSLVILQATWFFVQVVGRLAGHMPITLLEVNTIAHVVCAGMIFVLWWLKPRDAQEPIVLRGDWVPDVFAYMYISSRISSHKVTGLLEHAASRRPILEDLRWNATEQMLEDVRRDDASEDSSKKAAATGRKDIFGWMRQDDMAYLMNRRTVHRHRNSTKGADHLNAAVSLFRPAIDPSVLEQGTHNPRDGLLFMRQLARASAAINKYPAISRRFQDMQKSHGRVDCNTEEQPKTQTSVVAEEQAPSSQGYLSPEVSQLVVPFISNWPDDSLMSRLSGQIMGMVLWFASIVYGVIHVAAWNEYFPTHIEQMLWRFSASYIAASGLFWFTGCVFGFLMSGVKKWYNKLEDMRLPDYQMYFIVVGELLCGTAYIFSRAFLVVEAFASLRALPAGVYETPNWVTSVPHL